MKALILQHASFEAPGYILEWLNLYAFQTEILHLYKENTNFPALNDIKILIIMGGPMNVHDEKIYPWLVEEKKLIKQAIDHHVPLLGICLGGQLIADVCKADIYPAVHKEIGWFPIHTVPATHPDYFQFPARFTSFLWHGDQFDIPEEASLIGSSKGCPHQGFQLNTHTIGLQFHPEMTLPLLHGMIAHAQHDHDMIKTPYTQTAEDMLAVSKECLLQNHQLLDQLMRYLTQIS